MPQHLIILFVLVPMSAGIATLLLHRHRLLQRAVGAAALGADVGLAGWALSTVYRPPSEIPGVLVSQMGNWPAPFGITVAVDPLSAVFLLAAGVVALAVFGYAVAQLDGRFQGGYFHPLYHLLLFGVNWSFVTGDLFNLFVAFEILLMSSYALFCIGTTPKQMRQAHKYVLLNLIGSTIFVTALGLIYGQLGTLNMAHLSRMAMAQQIPPAAVPTVALLLLVFGTKAAAFPAWFWLPETYPALPPAVGGLFAGLLTKVGVYALLRVFGTVFGASVLVSDVVRPILLVSAGATMLLGALGAAGRRGVREMLSLLIISGVGYMLLGIGLGTRTAAAGTIFYAAQHMAGMSALFLCCGLIERLGGTDDLGRLGGLARRGAAGAALGVVFFVAAMNLVGLPPLSGFFGKWMLLSAALDGGAPGTASPVAGYVLAGVVLLTGAVTLLAMLRVWADAFWSLAPADARADARPARLAGGLIAAGTLVAVVVAAGLTAGGGSRIAESAAANVVDPAPYVAAVLGPNNVAPMPPAVALND